MRSDWPRVRLGDLIAIRHGYPFESELCSMFREGRPIVLSIGHFQETGSLSLEGKPIREYAGEYPQEYALKPGDLLLVMTCQTSGGEILGLPARVPDDGLVYLQNQRIGRVVPQSSDVDLGFLFWVFLSADFRQYLLATASGTKILHTAPSRIEEYELRLPPLQAQRTIARILNAIQEKLALNQRTSETIGSIAQALFRSWFLDFDPVRAKAQSKTPSGLDPRTAKRFPSEFIPSERGPIPKGFRAGHLGDLLTLQRGYELPRGARKPGPYPVLTASGEAERQSIAKIKGPGVVLGRSGVIGSVFLVQEDYWPLNTTLWVKELRSIGPHFAYCLLREMPLEDLNAGSAVPTLNRNDVHALPCILPPPALAAAFERRAAKYFRMQAALTRQSASLREIQASLLPRLLRGEISDERLQALRPLPLQENAQSHIENTSSPAPPQKPFVSADAPRALP